MDGLTSIDTAGRAVWLALPAYTGQIHLGTMRAILNDLGVMGARGDRVTILDECGNGLIGDARALMAAKFMAATSHDDDALVMIDQDVMWEAGKLAALVDKPVDLRVGIYPARHDPISFYVRWDQSSPQLMSSKATGLLKIAGAPAGLMVISRRMLRLMTEHYKDLNFFCAAAPNETVCGLFEAYWMRDVEMPNGKRGNVKLGEDYSFCQRWIDMGGEVWVDPRIKMGHVGFKTFEGSLHDWLMARKAQEAAPAPAAVADLFGERPGIKSADLPQPMRAFA